jgi:Zn-finger nucleic acid-binding protein
MDASSLHCPNCGAAVGEGAGRCPYCQARLATVSCPACFGRIFEDAAFCPRCGARRSRTEGAGAAAKCPGCRNELTHVTVGTTSLLECTRCDGVWMTAQDFEQICASTEAQGAVLHRWSGPPKPAGDAPVRYRPCVRCSKMMNRVNFGRLSGTIVDVCRGHGTFLDAGELHAIVRFVQEGGLNRSRERELEELREEQRRLREAQTAAAIRHADSQPRTAAAWSAEAVWSLVDWLKGD